MESRHEIYPGSLWVEKKTNTIHKVTRIRRNGTRIEYVIQGREERMNMNWRVFLEAHEVK